jgi:hypothetical protein
MKVFRSSITRNVLPANGSQGFENSIKDWLTVTSLKTTKKTVPALKILPVMISVFKGCYFNSSCKQSLLSKHEFTHHQANFGSIVEWLPCTVKVSMLPLRKCPSPCSFISSANIFLWRVVKVQGTL